jgi:predicted ribosome quality control (RQC) complex YloA/Tae2 family protein
MRSMSNIEYSYLCRELQKLVGGRLDKFYELGGRELRLRIRIPGKHEDLLVKLGERLHLTRYIRPAPATPSNFSMFIRKRLAGARLESIVQHGYDRVVVLRFRGETEHALVLEMFAEGNALLLEGRRISRAWRREEWKDRILREGQEYIFPASERLSPPFDKSALAGIMGRRPLMAVLVSGTNFGNSYLEEACLRAGLEPNSEANELSVEQLAALAAELNRIHENPVPLVYRKDGRAVDYSLTKLAGYSDLESSEAGSLSEAVDECANSGEDGEGEGDGAVKESRKEKLELRLRKQTERRDEMLEEAEECRKNGDGIYSRYSEIEEILMTIAEMKKDGKSWGEIKNALKGKCEIDEHKGTVYVG